MEFRIAGFARFQPEDNVQDLQGTDTVKSESEYMELSNEEVDGMLSGGQESKEGSRNWDTQFYQASVKQEDRVFSSASVGQEERKNRRLPSASMEKEDKKERKLLPEIPKNLEVAIGQPRIKGVQIQDKGKKPNFGEYSSSSK